MHPKVEIFLRESRQWQEEMAILREIVLNTKLEESFKWSKPCYTYHGRNIAIIQPFKGYLGLMFFTGELLEDPKGILKANGPNSQSARRLEFTSADEIIRLKGTIKAYINEAIAIADSGQKIERRKTPELLVDELEDFFKKKPSLKKAFEALTPGRQRAYRLHFSRAKQSETRRSRIVKCMKNIMEGKGLNDR
jgi:uncharacterized protein YdeI (YjbR/CyaY-like superfamily)